MKCDITTVKTKFDKWEARQWMIVGGVFLNLIGVVGTLIILLFKYAPLATAAAVLGK